MNVHITPSQREAEVARRERVKRLWKSPAVRLAPPVKQIAPPVAVKPKAAVKRKAYVQHDHHVSTFRLFQARYGNLIRTSGSYHIVQKGDYCPYEAVVSFDLSPVRKSMMEITLEVLEDYPEVSLAELRGAHRFKTLTRARQIAMYEIYSQRPDISYPAIGRFFNRDHTTVIHAVRKIAAERRAAIGPYVPEKRKITTAALEGGE